VNEEEANAEKDPDVRRGLANPFIKSFLNVKLPLHADCIFIKDFEFQM